jgi:hypothetical protein
MVVIDILVKKLETGVLQHYSFFRQRIFFLFGTLLMLMMIGILR